MAAASPRARRCGSEKSPAHRRGAALGEQERRDRDGGREREERVVRRQEVDAHQKPEPPTLEPRPLPKPKPPRASLPKRDCPSSVIRSTSSRFAFAA